MSRFPDAAALAAALSLLAAASAAAQDGKPGLGRPALPAEIAAWDIDVRPDGQGLPEGSGSVAEGEALYTEKCSSCHGVFGEAIGRWPQLAGGEDTLDSQDPVKTVGSYWPYLSTVYDYVHRAMPFGDAQSLTDDEVYAITAFLLNLNWIVDEDFVLSPETFGEIEMPNHGNFFMDDREEVEFAEFVREPCMTDCKDSVEITARARVIDVTPEQSGVAEGAAATSPEEPPAEAAAAAEAPDPEMVAAGERVFRQCQACHQVGEGAKNRVGPQLNDVIGRTAGSLDGFRYSGAFEELAAEGVVWTPETLDAFLEDPRGYARGTRMSFRGLDDADDRAAVTAYLSTFDE